MKKLRLGLLTKIILLTGLLTILTVATSLTVNATASYNNNRNAYKKSCEVVTDNLESVFFNSQNLSTANEVVNMLIQEYEKVKDNYTSLTEEQLTDYQTNVRTVLFDPAPGTLGLDYNKSARKNYYIEAYGRMLGLCGNYSVPYSALNIFDIANKRLIILAVNDTRSNDTIDNSLDQVGLVDSHLEEFELDFYLNASATDNSKTVIKSNAVMSYNLVDTNIENTNYKCFVRGQYPLQDINSSFHKELINQLLITAVSSIFLVIIYAIFTKLFLIKNVDKLKASTHKFVSMMKNDSQLEIVDSNVKSTDEIKELSDAFAVMQEQIITYVDNIKQAKSKEEAFKAEVDIASKIQLESLPAPSHFNRHLELRAFIKPAKGVGGDFYDYFYIDKDHLAVVIADVSGKGIPASLFMMRSKESIRSTAMSEEDLATAFFKVNNSLCINNKEGFFVTAFLGVLDLNTNEFTFISAGHERPFIKHNGETRRLEVKSNFVLGLEEDFVYEQEKVQLEAGDSVIFYTDGLNEAINSSKEEFGYERSIASLGKDNEVKQNLETLIKDLEEFEGDEEQFDDITLVAFKVKKDVVYYNYSNPTYDDIPDVTEKVETYLEDLDPVLVAKMGVVIDEVMNNIISYGRTKTNKTLQVSIEKTDGGATLIFIDNSHPFNPLLKEKRTIEQNMKEGIVGGVGISIVKSISKETEYVYSNNRNILIIKF